MQVLMRTELEYNIIKANWGKRGVNDSNSVGRDDAGMGGAEYRGSIVVGGGGAEAMERSGMERRRG